MKIKRFFPLLIVFLFYLFSTIAYSAMYSTMNITGSAFARLETGIKITSFKLATNASNGVSHYEEHTKNTISSKIQLFAFEDVKSVTYDIEITNYENYDAGILIISGLPSNLSYKLIDYQLTDKLCDENGKCNNGATKKFQLKITGSPGTYEFTLEFDFRKFHKVEYKNIATSNFPTEVIDGGNISITFNDYYERIIATSWVDTLWNHAEPWEQYSGEVTQGQTIIIENIPGNLVIENIIPRFRLVKGDATTPGSEICLKEECFYIIQNTNNYMYIISKYNLHVGGEYNGNEYIEYNNFTGKQDKTMQGHISNSSIRRGVLDFWSSMNYLQEYLFFLEEIETEINLETLIYNEYFECYDICEEESTKNCFEEFKCKNIPEWLSNTSFWILGFEDDGYAFAYDSIQNNIVKVQSTDYTNYGARPIISARGDEIKKSVDININGTIYKAEEQMTWGEWIKSEYNIINLQALYSGSSQMVNNNGHMTSDGKFVYTTDIIDSSKKYFIANSGGSGD